MGVAVPARGGVDAIAQEPEDGSVDEVEGKGDATEVLIEGGFEEGFEPGDPGHRRHEEGGSPEEVEPFVVEDGLRLQEAEIVPPGRGLQVLDVQGRRGDTAQEDADDEKLVEDEFFEPGEPGEESRKRVAAFIVLLAVGQKIEIAQEHPAHKHRVECCIGNVHEVEDEPELTPESGVPRAPRKGHEGCVDDNGAFKFDGDGPYVEVVGKPRLSTSSKDVAEVLELCIPFPNLSPIIGLSLVCGCPKAEQSANTHKQESRRHHGKIQSHPPPKQR